MSSPIPIKWKRIRFLQSNFYRQFLIKGFIDSRRLRVVELTTIIDDPEMYFLPQLSTGKSSLIALFSILDNKARFLSVRCIRAERESMNVNFPFKTAEKLKFHSKNLLWMTLLIWRPFIIEFIHWRGKLREKLFSIGLVSDSFPENILNFRWTFNRVFNLWLRQCHPAGCSSFVSHNNREIQSDAIKDVLIKSLTTLEI